jgi:hypothetical protein
MRVVPLMLAAFGTASAASAARAQDRFEIQVYDADSASPGEVGLETHLNHVFSDATETHLTLEPHYGAREWLELGAYLQTAVLADGSFDYAGVKLRAKVRLRDRLWNGRLGLALNGEISAVPSRFEANVWGTELRPIVDLELGPIYASVNPILAVDLGGDLAGHPQLEPAAKIALRLGTHVSVGLESYSAFGPLDDLGSEMVERLLAVLDYHASWIDLDLGAGHAWGTDDRWLVKAIVGVHR